MITIFGLQLSVADAIPVVVGNKEAPQPTVIAAGAVITGNVTINTTALSAAQRVRLKAVTNGVLLGGVPTPDRIYIGVVSG